MNEKDFRITLKDLCARLPYGVKVKTPYNNANLTGVIKRKGYAKGVEYIDAVTDKETYPIRYIKPYLRPMSSMTEEECDEVEDILGAKCIFDFMANGDIVIRNGYYTQKIISNLYDFFYSRHLDISGLIEKGLAIDCTGLQIYE